MKQVVGIKAVVAQFIHHDLIGGEVAASPAAESADQGIGSQEQNCLAQLIPRCAVFHMTHRAYRQYDFDSRIEIPEFFQRLPELQNGVAHCKPVSPELICRYFVTVGDNLTRGFQFVNPCGP